MIVVFNKKGITKEQLDSYGNLPRVGSQAFQIFAYFDGVDISNYGSAYIKLYRPDYSGSAYPILFMTLGDLTFDSSKGASSNYLQNGQTYPGFVFDFSKVRDTKGTASLSDDTVVTLLDTPGQWRAVITLVSKTKISNVVGSVSFNVGGVPANEDETEIDLDIVISTMADVLAEKLDKESAYYVREVSGFEAKAVAGQLPGSICVKDSIVFDESNTSFYKLNAVTENESEPGFVYCSSYTKTSLNISNLVPYSGANQALDLGNNYLGASALTVRNNGEEHDNLPQLSLPSITIYKDKMVQAKYGGANSISTSILLFPQMLPETTLGTGETIATHEWCSKNWVSNISIEADQSTPYTYIFSLKDETGFVHSSASITLTSEQIVADLESYVDTAIENASISILADAKDYTDGAINGAVTELTNNINNGTIKAGKTSFSDGWQTKSASSLMNLAQDKTYHLIFKDTSTTGNNTFVDFGLCYISNNANDITEKYVKTKSLTWSGSTIGTDNEYNLVIMSTSSNAVIFIIRGSSALPLFEGTLYYKEIK